MTDLESWEGDYPAPPAGEHAAGIEARIRLKLSRGDRLNAEEAEFFARMPADKRVEPRAVQRQSRANDEMRQRARDLPPMDDDASREQP